MSNVNHYKWLDKHFNNFIQKIYNKEENLSGMIVAHGDKCYGYKSDFEDAGIPFPHGVAIFLLSYMHPFNKEVRETSNGWVDVSDWVIRNKDRFIGLLDPIDENDPDVKDLWRSHK